MQLQLYQFPLRKMQKAEFVPSKVKIHLHVPAVYGVPVHERQCVTVPVPVASVHHDYLRVVISIFQ